MNPAINKLKEYLKNLKTVDKFSSIKEKSEHIGLINQIDTAIQQIHLCEKHGIVGGSLVNILPETETGHFQYIIAHENESTNSENWEEVLFDGQQIRLNSGDILIRK